MARIAGVDLPPSKRVDIGLTYIYGIGRHTATKILERAGVVGTLPWQTIGSEGDLRKATSMDIKRLIEIGCYRGMRHRRNLPCHGQRTHTNARTRRGPRRPIAGKKKATK